VPRHDGGMSDPEGRRLKQQLPYPYDQDLSKVLRGLKRRALKSRAKQANDPVTAAYLCAAVRLIQRHLGPGASRVPADEGDPDSITRPLLSFLSQRAVSEEVAHNPPPFHRKGSQRTMRDRWEPHSNFTADVLRFCLWAWHYPAQHIDEVADAIDESIRGPDPVRGLHRLCYWDLTRMVDTSAFRLGLIAAAAAEGIRSSARRYPAVTRRTTRTGRISTRSSCGPTACGSERRALAAHLRRASGRDERILRPVRILAHPPRRSIVTTSPGNRKCQAMRES
jgi:hypothetical protein